GRRRTRFDCDWSSDVCSSDLLRLARLPRRHPARRSTPVIRAHRSLLIRFLRDPSHELAHALTAPEHAALHLLPFALALCALAAADRKSTRLNSSHSQISYAVF